jgi:A/G-specific adenine glycosylase
MRIVKNIYMSERDAEHFYRYVKTNGLTSHAIRKFKTTIYRFYKNNGRGTLPWRHTNDPYHILLSEIMLQQTQIERVLHKYPLFIRKYPDFPSLSRARLRSLYTVWQGMGYNRRVLALKEIARRVVKPPYDGTLPSHMDELMALPSVGQSTAGAVAAFAFHQPVVFIETNIRRVFIHFFFQGQKKVTDHEIIPLIEDTLDRKDPRNWYYALMDYGSALRSLSVNPNIKSTKYKTQPPFEGSNRQMRGRILRLISKQQNMSVKKLAGQLNLSHDKIVHIIDQLCEEGFIKRAGRSIRMA